MKKILCFCLVCVMLFGLVACANNKPTEHLYTTHGVYFKVNDQNLLITPSGRPYIFTTDEKMNYKDGDMIQLNYENESKETYPEQIVAKNIIPFDGEIKLDNIIQTMKSLKEEYDFNFNDEIYKAFLNKTDKDNETDQKDKDEIESQLSMIAKIIDALDEGQNTMYSPLSLNFALALVSEGASTDVKKDFEAYFGMSFDDYIKLYSSYILNPSENLEIANAMYLREGLTFNEQFEKDIKNSLAAELGVEVFDNTFAEKVNAWCAEKTHDMIPSILNGAPDESIMSLVLNALYFEDEWFEEYEENNVLENTYKFYSFNDEVDDVNYLRSTEFTYYENDYATGFAKSYKNDRFCFIGILPKNEGKFTLSSLDLDSLLDSKQKIETRVLMPEFEFENTNSLTSVLSKIGLSSILKEGAFPNIASQSLHAESILQKTKIKVDREGTKASAVTVIEVTTDSIGEEPEYKTVELNRPFVFMVYDTETNLPMFIGKVINPVN